MAKSAREMVTEIDAALAARAPDGFKRRIRFGDRDITFDSAAELMDLRDYFARLADAEDGTVVGRARVFPGRLRS